MLRRPAFLALGLLTLTLTLAISASGYGATPACDLYASPTGSDSAAGSLSAPLRTVQRLADSLSGGQVGCLRAGADRGLGRAGDPYRELKITRAGITLTSAPGEQARIDARLWVARGADGVTVSGLHLDGTNTRDLPSPTVNADGAVFRHNDVTNGHTGICFVVGSSVWGRAEGTLIEENRIHGCGETPATNQEHGIYLSAADDTVIRGNWIYDNTDRGIQMYPDAQRTVITGNVIYGNGEGMIFSGNDEVASSGARVTNNVIAGSQIRRNVESYYVDGAPRGSDNLVRSNCIHGAPGSYYGGPDGSGVQSPQVGFTAVDNVNASRSSPMAPQAISGCGQGAPAPPFSTPHPTAFRRAPSVAIPLPRRPRPRLRPPRLRLHPRSHLPPARRRRRPPHRAAASSCGPHATVAAAAPGSCSRVGSRPRPPLPARRGSTSGAPAAGTGSRPPG